MSIGRIRIRILPNCWNCLAYGYYCIIERHSSTVLYCTVDIAVLQLFQPCSQLIILCVVFSSPYCISLLPPSHWFLFFQAIFFAFFSSTFLYCNLRWTYYWTINNVKKKLKFYSNIYYTVQYVRIGRWSMSHFDVDQCRGLDIVPCQICTFFHVWFWRRSMSDFDIDPCHILTSIHVGIWTLFLVRFGHCSMSYFDLIPWQMLMLFHIQFGRCSMSYFDIVPCLIWHFIRSVVLFFLLQSLSLFFICYSSFVFPFLPSLLSSFPHSSFILFFCPPYQFPVSFPWWYLQFNPL